MSPARTVPGATRRVGNASRTPSLAQTQRREAAVKQVGFKWRKILPKVTMSTNKTQNVQCPGTNQKYCASQQGDCKHIGYCDPNATCKKKANVSIVGHIILIQLVFYTANMWVLLDWSHIFIWPIRLTLRNTTNPLLSVELIDYKIMIIINILFLQCYMVDYENMQCAL